MDEALLERYADLIVRFGANVQPGQEVRLLSSVGKQELTRAIATRLYQVGAVFVSVRYGDSHIDRARLECAVDEALGYEPDWIVQMIRDHGTGHGATIGLSGNPWPGLLEGVDPERIARDRVPGRNDDSEPLWSPRALTVIRIMSGRGIADSEYGCDCQASDRARNRQRKNWPGSAPSASRSRPVM